MEGSYVERPAKKRNELLDPGNLLFILYIVLMVCFILLGSLSEGYGTETEKNDDIRPENARRGELLMAREDGQLQRAPLVSQKVKIKISGITARVVVEQQFINSSEQWLEAIYVFPLPDESSVDHLRLRIGERVLQGEIKEKSEARAIHEKAKREGRKSSLLSQNRPNIFTTRVANIGPGEQVSVVIEYQQLVHVAGGLFSLRFPMVVGPRYIPGQPLAEDGGESVQLNRTGWAVNTDQVPDASEITPPVDLKGETTIPVDFTIDLAAGFAVSELNSLYHGIDSRETGEGHYAIALTGEVVADRDFVLEWRARDSRATRAALFAESLDDNQYMLLMLMPPESEFTEVIPREVVVILDISGSMAGASIVQAKKAVATALDSLRPIDRFNLIVFNDKARRLFSGAEPADETHLNKARRFIDGVKAGGGTEMKPALLLALDGSNHHERFRQVVFVTDGAVGNEDALFTLITKRLGDSRLFTVGIGSAPNSYFMTRAAAMGRGTFTYIGKESEAQEKMRGVFAKLEHPVITDLKIESASDGKGIEMYPAPLPDLYQGEPLTVALRTKWQNEELHISGTRLGRPWQISVDTATYGRREGIGALWARKKIRSYMESLALGADASVVREEVLKTALTHHLVSKYTSLIAVDTQVSRPGNVKQTQAAVKTHLPQGWQASAVFGGNAQTATPAPLRLLIGVVLLISAAVFAVTGRRSCQSI